MPSININAVIVGSDIVGIELDTSIVLADSEGNAVLDSEGNTIEVKGE